MADLISIAAVGENNVIGKDNKLLWHYPEDFKHFKNTTMGYPMIMGRNTFESMGALPGRTSIVLTRNSDYAKTIQKDNVFIVQSVWEALKMVRYSKSFVVGGAKIYEEFMPYINKMIISRIPITVDGDAYYPVIDDNVWSTTERVGYDGFEVQYYEKF